MRGTAVVMSTGMLVVAAGCSSSSSSPSAPAVSQSPQHVAFHPRILHTMKVGKAPCAVEGGFGSIWVSLYGSETELRIDPATRNVLARIHVGEAPCGVAVGAGSVWVENFKGNTVSRIDPNTNRVIKTIDTGLAPYDVTYGFGAAWVTNYNVASVTRIDADTDKATTIKVGNNPNGIAPTPTAIVVTNRGDGTISVINPTTEKVTTKSLGTAPSWTAWGNGQLWVADVGQLDEVDSASYDAGRVVSIPGQPNDGDVVHGTVWVPDASGKLNKIVGGQLIGSLPLHLNNPFVLAGYAGSLWVVDFKGTKLEQIDPGP